MTSQVAQTTRPAAYELAESDVAWEPQFLELVPPRAVRTLADFGYLDDDLALSPVAITGPFRVLSDEGAAAAERIAGELGRHAQGDARSKRLRGCTYRSEFFAGMYSDPRLIAFLAELARADLREHPIGHHRVQLNFAPDELAKDVDVWHYDVVSYDFVMLCTDPSAMQGGNTEFFEGTVEEGMRILDERGALPPQRIGKVDYPGAGWAFLQQGHRVLHRAGAPRSALPAHLPGRFVLLRGPALSRADDPPAAAQGGRARDRPRRVGKLRRLPDRRAAAGLPRLPAGLLDESRGPEAAADRVPERGRAGDRGDRQHRRGLHHRHRLSSGTLRATPEAS